MENNGTFRDLKFPATCQYSSYSEHQPIEFYQAVLPKARSMDMVLGYFSTNAIRTLCSSFAEFIYNGGALRIVTNHQLSAEDKENLLVHTDLKEPNKVLDIFQDVELLKIQLGPIGQHFFDCLKYLMSKERLEVIPVKHRPNALAHYKNIMLFDGESYLYAHGSANFTSAGIIRNGESFIVDKSWGSLTEETRIKEELRNFELIFNRSHPSFEYLDANDVMEVIYKVGNSETELELLEKAVDLRKSELMEDSAEYKKMTLAFIEEVEELKATPRFPFPEGPRDYQTQAYENWVQNGYQGIFAMATGTGKTITALNCILQEYKRHKHYRFLVLVPTIALADQWQKEVAESFNFNESTICSSRHQGWQEQIKRYGKNLLYGTECNFCLIATYATFRGHKFQELFFRYFAGQLDNITLIADEAHTLGSPQLLALLPTRILKRIGLSATPKRVYDPDGEAQLGNFFAAFPPHYTFVYDMKQAIDEEVLCRYFYFPKLVDLEPEELLEYKKITKELTKYIDQATGKYKDHPIANNLLIQRKNIVHKASRKEDALMQIVEHIGSENFKYAFIYVPEGNNPKYDEIDVTQSDEEDIRIINRYTEHLHSRFQLKLRKYLGETKDRDEILYQFSHGNLDAILAMKCLDEGVDVPRTQYAIFCSSTGNPRQYVQRRGRVLRKHREKDFAYIFDMVVKPPVELTYGQTAEFNLERNLLRSELKRLVNFAALAENKIEILRQLEDLGSNYNVDIYEMMNNELENYETT